MVERLVGWQASTDPTAFGLWYRVDGTSGTRQTVPGCWPTATWWGRVDARHDPPGQRGHGGACGPWCSRSLGRMLGVSIYEPHLVGLDTDDMCQRTAGRCWPTGRGNGPNWVPRWRGAGMDRDPAALANAVNPCATWCRCRRVGCGCSGRGRHITAEETGSRSGHDDSR